MANKIRRAAAATDQVFAEIEKIMGTNVRHMSTEEVLTDLQKKEAESRRILTVATREDRAWNEFKKKFNDGDFGDGIKLILGKPLVEATKAEVFEAVQRMGSMNDTIEQGTREGKSFKQLEEEVIRRFRGTHIASWLHNYSWRVDEMEEQRKTLNEREAKLEKFNEDLQAGIAEYKAKTERFAKHMEANEQRIAATRKQAEGEYMKAQTEARKIIAQAEEKRIQAELMMAQATALPTAKATLMVSDSTVVVVPEGQRYIWLRNKRTGNVSMYNVSEDFDLGKWPDYEIAPPNKSEEEA